MRNFGKLQLGVVLLTLLNIAPAVEADDSWWALALAAGCAVASFALAKPGGGSYLPSWIVFIGVVGSVFYSLHEMLQPQTVYILDLGRFIILLACCKFFEIRSHRDMALIAVIAFLLLVIGAFVSARPLFGIVLFLDVTFGVAWLMKFQVQRDWADILDRRRAALAFVRSSGVSAAAAAPTVEGSPWKPAMTHAVGLILLAAVVFIVVPRGWGRGIFGRFQRLMPLGVTNLSENIRLTDASIIQDPTLVMRVKFLHNGRPYGGEDFQPYLRGASFDRYKDNQWRRTTRSVLSELAVERDGNLHMLPHAPGGVRGDQVLDLEVWLESLDRGMLFSINPPVAIGSKDIRRVLQRRSDLTLQADDSLRGSASYRVTAMIPGTPLTARPPDAPGSRFTRVAALSGIHPAVRFFAREYFAQFGDAGDPDQHAVLARQVCDFLRSGEFTYTLSRGESDPETDHVKNFLFQNRRGHCEYFASAMTLMCQSLGIPARLVSGYYAGEYNNVGGFYLFRTRDAHAWVEVWLPERGWTTFDPSPPSDDRLQERHETFLNRISRFNDFLQFKWATSVVSFDAASRSELFENFENWLRRLVEIRHRPRSIGEGVATLLWGPDLLPIGQRFFYWLLLILVVVFVMLLVRISWILWLMFREFLTGARRPGLVRRHQARFYDRLLLLLANKGFVKPRHQTPREFAADLSATHPDLVEMPRFIDWFYQVQYGDGSLSGEQWRRIKAFLDRLREDPAFGAR